MYYYARQLPLCCFANEGGVSCIQCRDIGLVIYLLLNRRPYLLVRINLPELVRMSNLSDNVYCRDRKCLNVTQVEFFGFGIGNEKNFFRSKLLL